MPTPNTLLLFVAGAIPVLATPGPSVVFVVARSAEHGRRAGLVSVLGVELGALVHVVAAAAGVSAIVASSPGAIAALRYAGAAYLLWLGLRSWGGGGAAADRARAPASYPRLLRDALLVDLLNPSTTMFFLAFLPLFVHDGHGAVGAQAACLGLCFLALAGLTDAAYALAAARVGRRVRVGAGGGRRLARAGAGAYCLLAVLALAGA